MIPISGNRKSLSISILKRTAKGHKKQRYGKMDRKFKEKPLIARPVAWSAMPMKSRTAYFSILYVRLG